ncbi:MAG: putrescine transport system substrate-binding protein [Gammaproteobacteria bacterium]|nr:putrescine transport system substrate-binding protein [Gammaproteobacteria bacterium]
MRRTELLVGLIALVLVAGCGKQGSIPQSAQRSEMTDDEKTVNLFIWADDIAPDTLTSFEKQTGVKVRVSNFDSPETLESRMLMGSSGFDVVVPTAAFIQRQIRSGAYLVLDKTQLPNLANLDPALMSRVALNDPENAHGIVYTWGTFGIGINKAMVSKLLPDNPLNSWRLLFDPELAVKAAKCGLNLMDDPVGVVRLILIYLGRNPNEPTSRDLADVEQLLAKIRPFIRNIDTSSQIQALANGDLCMALAYNGNVVQASKRAKETHNGIVIDYLIPEEGTLLWFDLMTIPKDAPHLANAYRFLNYILDPHVISNISNTIAFANANRAATSLLDPAISADPAVYPRLDQQQRLVTQVEPSPEQARAITRLWQRFKTGQ